MTFLPIVERELRIGARQPGTYWMRTGLGAMVCLIWLFVLGASSATTPVNVKALILFWTVAVPAFGFCLLAGMFLTADCISGERREGTLGLLFLTDLESYDVVFGKLAATSLHAAYGLLCILPSLALSLLIGGVTMGEFWRVTLVLAVTMFLSLTIGLAISAISREARQAMVGTLLVLAGLAGIPPLLWWLAHTFTPSSTMVVDFLLVLCPPYDLALARDVAYGTAGGARIYWTSLLVQIGFSVLALVLAGSWVPRVWADAPEENLKRDYVWQRWFQFGRRAVKLRRRKAMEANPFCWLATRDRLPQVLAWAAVTVLFAIWAVFLGGSFVASPANSKVCFTVAVFMGYGAYVLWKTFVAIEAARRISEDRQTGALELMLVTTLEVERILSGQRRALKQMFLGPGLVVLFMNVVLLGMVADGDQMRLESGLSGKSCLVFAVGALFVAADLSALSDAGSWMGLRARRLQHAFLGMLGRVMLMPWVGVAFFAVTLMSGAALSAADMYILLFVWMMISLVVDGIAGAKARRGLEKGFRLAAAGDVAALNVAADGEAALSEAPQPA